MSVPEATSSPSSPLRACPACGGELRYWRSVPASEPTLGELRFELWRCRGCGSAVTQGGSDAALHDAGAYRAGTPRLYRLAQPVLRRFDHRRLVLARRLAPPPARLLDAGAGRGRFVLAAEAAGYEASGIEPSARGAEAAAASGADVIQASIEAAWLHPASVDLITLWHVLEHLDDPGSALSRLRSWLRPGGGLIVGVPNLASLQARLGGERWYHLDVPRHRVHYTVRGLRSLLEREGFDCVSVEHRLLEHNPYGMWQSCVNRVTRHPSYLYNLLKRNAPVWSPDLAVTAAMLPLAPLAGLVEVAAGLVGRGGTIAVLARRRG